MPLSKNGIYFIQQLDNPFPYGREIVPRNHDEYKEEDRVLQEAYGCVDTSGKVVGSKKEVGVMDSEEPEKEKELYRQDI